MVGNVVAAGHRQAGLLTARTCDVFNFLATDVTNSLKYTIFFMPVLPYR